MADGKSDMEDQGLIRRVRALGSRKRARGRVDHERGQGALYGYHCGRWPSCQLIGRVHHDMDQRDPPYLATIARY